MIYHDQMESFFLGWQGYLNIENQLMQFTILTKEGKMA